MNSFLRKIRSRHGESIAEALIALLISSVGLMMFAGMITSSVRLITRSKTVLHSYYQKNNVLETRDGRPAGSMNMILKTGGTSGTETESFEVTYYENSTIGSRPVISYRAR